MDSDQRNKRLRLLLRKVNRRHKKQAKKIDILCNDLIGAQRDFVSRLKTISFAACFYKEIVGKTELSSLFHVASGVIKGEVVDANVTFFLREANKFEVHTPESENSSDADDRHFESCFAPSLVDDICRANKMCDLDDLLAMGLQGNPAMLKKITAVTIPLGQSGTSLGFILIYRSSKNKLSTEHTNRIAEITPGLSQAIINCHEICQLID